MKVTAVLFLTLVIISVNIYSQNSGAISDTARNSFQNSIFAHLSLQGNDTIEKNEYLFFLCVNLDSNKSIAGANILKWTRDMPDTLKSETKYFEKHTKYLTSLAGSDFDWKNGFIVVQPVLVKYVEDNADRLAITYSELLLKKYSKAVEYFTALGKQVLILEFDRIFRESDVH